MEQFSKQTDSPKEKEDKWKESKPTYNAEKIAAKRYEEKMRHENSQIDHKAGSSSDEFGNTDLIGDAKRDEGGEVNIAKLCDDCEATIIKIKKAIKNKYLLKEQYQIINVNEVKYKYMVLEELRGMIESVTQSLDLLEKQGVSRSSGDGESQEPRESDTSSSSTFTRETTEKQKTEKSLGELNKLWKEFRDDFNDSMKQPSLTLGLNALHTNHNKRLSDILYLVEGIGFNHRVEKLEKDKKFIQEHMEVFKELSDNYAFFTQQMEAYGKIQKTLSEHYNKEYDMMLIIYPSIRLKFNQYCETGAKIRQEIEDFLEKGTDWNVSKRKEPTEKFLKELLQIFPVLKDFPLQRKLQKLSIDGQMHEEVHKQSDSGHFFDGSPQKPDTILHSEERSASKPMSRVDSMKIEAQIADWDGADSVVNRGQKHPDEDLRATESPNSEETSLKHLNAADEYESLKKEIINLLQEMKAVERLSQFDKYVLEKEETDKLKNIIEKYEIKLEKAREQIKRIIQTKYKSIKYAIENETKTSDVYSNKLHKIQKKYISSKFIINAKRLNVTKKVEKELFRILEDKWTNTEMQLERAKCYIMSKDILRELSSKWDKIPFLRDLPFEQAWCLCAAEKYPEDHDPEFIVDTVPFYVLDRMRVFKEMLNGLCIDELNFDGHRPEELTGEYLMQLHDMAVKETYREMDEDNIKQRFDLGYTEKNTCLNLERDVNCSKAGLDERSKKLACRQGGPKVDARYGEAGHPVGNCWNRRHHFCEDKIQHINKSMTQEERRKIVDDVINQYHKEIDSAKEQNDEDAKLTAIVRCCQDLYQIHPFLDGNTRTIVAGVLPKLLLENGFCPSILRNPKMLAGYSVEEIKDAVREGQQVFQKLCELAHVNQSGIGNR
jgi:hypothetical protein